MKLASVNVDFFLILTDAPGEQAYPITATSFVLMYKQPKSAVTAADHTRYQRQWSSSWSRILLHKLLTINVTKIIIDGPRITVRARLSTPTRFRRPAAPRKPFALPMTCLLLEK